MDASRLDCGFLFKAGSKEAEAMRLGEESNGIMFLRGVGKKIYFQIKRFHIDAKAEIKC